MARLALFLIVTLLFAAQQPAAQQGGGSTAAAPTMLDYEVFKARVQPILMSPRKGNARCMACHATGGGNSYLEQLPPGTTTYSEEQTRRNFERVARLVTPGEPLKSLLLVNPLAQEAGGSHWHGGGKHWQSQNDAEWQTLATWVRTRSTTALPPAPAARAATTPSPAPVSSLDYDTFKTRVQPILMSPRKGNARCMACHATGGGNSYLEVLPPGTTTYTEDQTRRNFERVTRLVTPGEPLKSLLLVNPLAQEAGGSHWHGGGKHWQSQNDAEWQTLAAWVRSGRS